MTVRLENNVFKSFLNLFFFFLNCNVPLIQASAHLLKLYNILYNTLTLFWYSITLASLHSLDKLPQGCGTLVVTTEMSMQRDGCCLAGMFVLAGKQPTLRSSDSQTHAHTQTLCPRGSAGMVGVFFGGALCV